MLETMKIDRNELDELLDYKRMITSGKCVQVVRCSECKHGSQTEDYFVKGGEVRCLYHEIITGLTDYCSYGILKNK